MAKTTHKVHGVNFVRTGSCNQCKGCEPDCIACPHGERKADGKVYCKIQDTKEDVCDYCTNNSDSEWYKKGREVTHQVCIDFPDHPWLGVIKKGICNYKFTPTTKEDKEKFNKLNDTWR